MCGILWFFVLVMCIMNYEVLGGKAFYVECFSETIGEATKKWTIPIQNWGIILNQFILIFGERTRL